MLKLLTRYQEIVAEIMNLKVRHGVLEQESAEKQEKYLETINSSQALLASVKKDGIDALKVPELFALHERQRVIFTSLNRVAAEIKYLTAVISEYEDQLREIKKKADSSLDLLKNEPISRANN
jgi:hypothetical protein